MIDDSLETLRIRKLKYLALDQNRWIELSNAIADPTGHPKHFNILKFLIEEVRVDRLRVPLFQSNIYETHKIQDDKVRGSRAEVQCTLSKGLVVLGLHFRRAFEVRQLLSKHFDKPVEEQSEGWFLSNRFWEAASLVEIPMDEKFVQYIEGHPSDALFSYLTYDDGGVRSQGITNFSDSLRELIARIEKQRLHLSNESVSMRRKALSVQMWMDSQDSFWDQVDFLGIPTIAFKQSSPTIMKDLIREVPCLFIERELRLVLEAEPGKLTENDAMDMQFFCAALPYMNVVAAEKGFSNRARQAKLDEKFDTSLVTDLISIPDALAAC